MPLLDAALETTKEVVDERQAVRRLKLGGKRRFPAFERVGGACLIAGHFEVILIGDGQALALAGVVAPFIRELRVGFRAIRLSEVAVDPREADVRRGQVRIELDGAQEERDRFGGVRHACQRLCLRGQAA